MTRVNADLVSDLFWIEFEGEPLDAAKLTAAVASFNETYETRVITPEEARTIVKSLPPPPPMPEFVRSAIDRARKEGKLVAFDCMAEWCAPCRKMLEEVLPHEDVREVMERYFILVTVDVDKQPEAARWFQSSGIPDL